ncbi:MAG: methenyltetrahydromethanopterin cyclohydrolase, partial [Pirellula sp.]
MPTNLNSSARELIDRQVVPNLSRLRIAQQATGNHGCILDFGCQVPGGLEAGLLLAKICLADLANVQIVPADLGIWHGPMLQVTTDDP